MKNIKFPWIVLAAAALLLFPLAGLSAGADQEMKVDSNRPVTFDREYQVGGKILAPGEYKVQHQISDSGQHFAHFVPANRKAETIVVPVECEMEPSGAKIQITRAESVDQNGVRRMRKLKVQGNNAAFVFE